MINSYHSKNIIFNHFSNAIHNKLALKNNNKIVFFEHAVKALIDDNILSNSFCNIVKSSNMTNMFENMLKIYTRQVLMKHNLNRGVSKLETNK